MRAFSTSLFKSLLGSVCLTLAACGGGGGGPPPPPPSGIAPTITTQPANASVTAGLPASFTVGASGDAPLAYQWQRNGVDIAGATATSYAIAATTLADSGALFRAVVTNATGSATSNPATLTVVASPPVLTITLQPANASVVAGGNASFTVAATCSSATLAIRWQRSAGGGAWADITGASAATFTLAAAIGDNGAQFRAALDCSGQSATTSAAATLSVTAPAAVSMSGLPVAGLRDQADITNIAGIVQDGSGSFTFLTTNRIKRLSADFTSITPVAGGGAPAGAIDGPADTARFNAPLGLAQAADGTLYVADTGNHTIRKVTAAGVVSTLAGSAGAAGFANGSGAAARFSSPIGIAIGPDGDLYVGDTGNHLIRRITTAGVVSTYAGSTSGFANGAPLSAQFTLPRGVAVGPDGTVYVADYGNLRIRTIARSGGGAGLVSTLAGNGMNQPGSPDGAGNVASLPFPWTLALRGNSLAFVDESYVLRQVDITTGTVSTLAGTRTLIGVPGLADGAPGKGYLHVVRGIVPMAAGGYMVADTDALRTVSAAGVIRTIATAAPQTNATADGIGTLPQVTVIMGPNTRQALTVDAVGNVLIADVATQLVRRIAPSGAVTLVAGLPGGQRPDGGGVQPVDGVLNEAQFVSLGPIATSSSGTIYVTDNYAVRKITADGTVSFVAGSYSQFGSVNGNATTARFSSMLGIAVGPIGDVFVSDGHAIRRIDLAGNVTTYAGALNQAGDVDGPAATARFSAPGALAFGPDGTLYVVSGSTIRTISPDGATVSRLAVDDLRFGLAVDEASTVYYGAASGLRSVSAAGVNTLIVPAGPTTTTGANPTLLAVFGLAMLGPKQLVVQANNSLLMTVTLP